MIVVFDTNVWKSDLYRRSGASLAVRFWLRQSGAIVAIPEVIRLEIESELRNDLTTWITSIKDNHRQLLGVFRSLKDIILPEDSEISTVVKEATKTLDVTTRDIPFSLESAYRAFLKVVQKEAPCATKQQFKDAVIWHDCLELAKTDDVVLVTNDRAFYKNSKIAEGLAPNLEHELSKCPYRITIVHELSQLLDQITDKRNPLDDDFPTQLQQHIQNKYSAHFSTNGFAIEKLISCVNKPFATDQSDVIFVEFNINWHCKDVRGDNRTSAVCTAVGNTLFRVDTKDLIEIRTFSVELSYILPDGTPESKKNLTLFAGPLIIGHQDVTYNLHHPL